MLKIWRWEVVSAGALLIFGLGASAVWAGEYRFGALLIVGSTVWVIATAAETFGPLRAIVVGTVWLGICFLCIQYQYDSTQVAPAAPPKPIRAPSIIWRKPASIEAGAPLSTTQLNASAVLDGKPLEGTFTYVPAPGVKLPVGTSTLTVTFSPSEPDKYASQAGAVEIEIKPKAPPKRSKPLLIIEFLRFAGNPGWEVVAINKTADPVDNVSVGIARSHSGPEIRDQAVLLKDLRERIVVPETQTILGNSLKHLRELPPTLYPYPDKPSLFQIDFTTRYENFIEYLYLTPRPDGGFDQAIDMGSLKSQAYFMHDAEKAQRASKNWPEWWK